MDENWTETIELRRGKGYENALGKDFKMERIR
jgi:hypothetical protein